MPIPFDGNDHIRGSKDEGQMNSLTYLGEVGFTTLLPVIGSARNVIEGAVLLQMPDLQARLAGAVNMQLNYHPPSIAVSLQVAEALVASLSAAITPPGIDVSVSVVADLILQLRGIIAALNLALNWGNFAGEISLFVYNGTAGAMGTTVQGAVNAGYLGSIPAGSMVIAPVLMCALSNPVAKASLELCVKVA
jgi:hypothetical protein